MAAAIEVLHTAMLVHDDLLDHDEVRRGRPNVAGATRARLAGPGLDERTVSDQVLAAGLLAGDLAIASAFSLVVGAPADPAALLRVVGLLAEGIETTVVGELLDVTASLSSPRDVDALAVAELKTAAYSGALPLVVGAVLAGADEERIARLGAVGSALGVAFQLTDDELGRVRRPRGDRQVRAVGPAGGQAHGAAAAGVRDGRRGRVRRAGRAGGPAPTSTTRVRRRSGR